MIDLGTGDGHAVVAAARADPTALVVGIDASVAPMAEASRRAARPAAKGGLPNALFVVAAAESPPPELRARASLVSVLFPWGSLLRGILGLDQRAAGGLVALVAPNGAIDALVSVTPRDGIDGIRSLDRAALDRLAATFGRSGFELTSAAPASPADVRATGSTWGRRLVAAGADRPVWRLSLSRKGRPGP
jgi:16S rRNA (adenine(1408)-N(1))-methyltransferase